MTNSMLKHYLGTKLLRWGWYTLRIANWFLGEKPYELRLSFLNYAYVITTQADGTEEKWVPNNKGE